MEYVKMSKKGQLVVPLSIRKLLGLASNDKFIAYGEADYIIFKKIELPSLKKEFDELIKVTSKITKARGITPDVVASEIAKYRKTSRRNRRSNNA